MLHPSAFDPPDPPFWSTIYLLHYHRYHQHVHLGYGGHDNVQIQSIIILELVDDLHGEEHPEGPLPVHHHLNHHSSVRPEQQHIILERVILLQNHQLS